MVLDPIFILYPYLVNQCEITTFTKAMKGLSSGIDAMRYLQRAQQIGKARYPWWRVALGASKEVDVSTSLLYWV